MQYNVLGKTGLRVSRMGFGCIKFKEETQAKVTEALNLALDKGINFLDTARSYGCSEKMIRRKVASFRYEQRCMQCGYCQPCPEGIDIPKVLRAIAYKKSDRIPDEESVRIALKVGEGPETCLECGQCVEACPAAIDIPKIMRQEAGTFYSLLDER